MTVFAMERLRHFPGKIVCGPPFRPRFSLEAYTGLKPCALRGRAFSPGGMACIWFSLAREIEFIAAVREGFESYEREGGTSTDEEGAAYPHGRRAGEPHPRLKWGERIRQLRPQFCGRINVSG